MVLKIASLNLSSSESSTHRQVKKKQRHTPIKTEDMFINMSTVADQDQYPG